MKATIEIPDDLYRSVKAKSALDGLTVKDATIQLYRAWVDARPVAIPEPDRERDLEAWFRSADKATTSAPHRRRRAAREELSAGRSRLDRR